MNPSTRRAPRPLQVYLLGQVELDAALTLQRRFAYDVGEEGRVGSLLLCEHPTAVTVGRSGRRLHLRPDDGELAAAGVPVRWVNRGGGAVVHAPGQLNAYVVLHLERLGLSVQGLVDGLHEALREVVGDFGLTGATRPGAPGVWLGGARVATVGVAVHRWISTFGVTLNVGPYLRTMDILEEPGPDGGLVHQTSLESRRQRPAPMAAVRERLIGRLEERFALERHDVFTDHPLLRRKPRHHVIVSRFG
jgi:lipoyl(octanoyl) transferase